MVPLTWKCLKEGRLYVKIRGTDQQRAYEVDVHLSDVEWMDVGTVYWNAAQCDNHYDGTTVTRFLPRDRWFDTVRDYFEEVMKMDLNRATAFMPVWMMQALVYERGVRMRTNSDEVKKWDPPIHYEPLAKKIAWARRQPEWTEPKALWTPEGPTQAAFEVLKRFPPAIPDWGEDDKFCPAGSGWFGVTLIKFRETSDIWKEYRVKEGIPCVQQLLAGNGHDGRVEAWAPGTGEIVLAPEGDGISELEREQARFVYEANQRNGCWVEVSREAERVQEDRSRSESVESIISSEELDDAESSESSEEAAAAGVDYS